MDSYANTTLLSRSRDNDVPPDEQEIMDVHDFAVPVTVNHFALFLSTFAWIFILAAFVGSGFLFRRYHPAQVVTSKPLQKSWEEAGTPKIFTHATDLHLCFAEPLKIISTRLLVKSMEFYKPDFHLITGDIVDSYGEENWPKIGRQIKGDWEIWQKIIDEETENFTMLDIPGNHEMWGIIEPLSKQNLYLDYSQTYNRSNTRRIEDFIVRTKVVDGLTFVLINIYTFPNGHPPYFYWPHPSRYMLDLIEDVIEKTKDCYVIVHQPIDNAWWITSSKGHTYEEIMQNPNIIAIFSGHLHPVYPVFVHHKDGPLECIGAGTYQRKKFGLVTIDNGQLVYHTVDMASTTRKFFLTYPIPKEQLSSHMSFNEKDSEIRLISYAKKNVSILVMGDFLGKLKYKETLPNGADLYTMPLNIEKEGEYTIELTGDGCNITCNFYYGKQYKGKKEPYILAQRGFFFLRITIIPFFLALLWIWFPCKLPFVPKEAEQWIEGIKRLKPHWIQAILAGPNFLRYRVQELPAKIRYMMLFFTLYPLWLPNHIFKPIFGNMGYSFMCFVVIGDQIQYDEWAIQMSFFYLAFFPGASTLLMANTKYFRRSWVYWFCLFWCFCCWFGSQFINWRWIGEAVPVPLLFLNPTFVIAPAIIYFVYFRYLIKSPYWGELFVLNEDN